MARSTAGRLALIITALAVTVSACSTQTPAAGPEPRTEAESAPPAEPAGPGEWEATCTEVEADSASLAENLTGAISDPSNALALANTAKEAITPLADCDPGFLAELADHLTGAWEDGEAAAAAAEAVRALAPAAPEAQVEDFTPFTSDGRVSLAIEYPDPDQPHQWFIEESCHASPVASAANVYQCGTTAHNLPACWRTDAYSFTPTLACMHSPDDDTVVFVLPTETVPEPVEAYEDPAPWQVTLLDGSTCRVRLGGAWPEPPAGSLWSHGCEGGQIAALVVPESGSTLQMREGTLVALGAATVEPTAEVTATGVQKVVYAGEAIEPAPAQTGSACPALTELEAALREVNEKLSFLTEIEAQCVGDWVLAFAGDEMSANTQVFQRVKGAWVARNTGEECTLPSPLPAALYAPHCMAG